MILQHVKIFGKDGIPVAIIWSKKMIQLFKCGVKMKNGEKMNTKSEDRKLIMINEAIQAFTTAKQLIEQLQNRRIATGTTV